MNTCTTCKEYKDNFKGTEGEFCIAGEDDTPDTMFCDKYVAHTNKKNLFKEAPAKEVSKPVAKPVEVVKVPGKRGRKPGTKLADLKSKIKKIEDTKQVEEIQVEPPYPVGICNNCGISVFSLVGPKTDHVIDIHGKVWCHKCWAKVEEVPPGIDYVHVKEGFRIQDMETKTTSSTYEIPSNLETTLEGLEDKACKLLYQVTDLIRAIVILKG